MSKYDYGALPESGGAIDGGDSKRHCWAKYGAHVVAAGLVLILVVLTILALALVRAPVVKTGTALTIESILGGEFAAKKYAPVWLDDGNFLYKAKDESGKGVIFEFDSSSLKARVLVNTSSLVVNGERYGDSFSTFSASSDKSMLLFALQAQKQFRSSFFAKWVVYDLKTQSSRYLLNGAFAANPVWNPNKQTHADTLAIVQDNNVLILSAVSGETSAPPPTITRVTTDGSKLVFNGIMDWLYEEEVFESSNALYWSPDGSQLAYLKLNDTLVGEVPYPWFDPVSSTPNPSFRTVRYPKSGTTNPTASAHVFTPETGETSTLKLPPGSEYITSIGWVADRPGEISVRVLPRIQQIETMVLLNATTGENVHTIVTQRMPLGWVESRPYSYIWIDRKRFVDIRVNDNYYHVAMTTVDDQPGGGDGGFVTFLTSGSFSVMEIVGFDHATSEVYFMSTEHSTFSRDLYRVNLAGEARTKLTSFTSHNSVNWGPGGIYVVDGSSAKIPPQQWVAKKGAATAHEIVLAENSWITSKLSTYDAPTKKLTMATGSHGDELNAVVIYPPTGPRRKEIFPVLFTYYNGPTSNRALDQWTLGFNEWISARLRMIVVVMDAAGTAGKSVSFNQQTFKRLGIRETEDQLAGMKSLLAQDSKMDSKRLACWGWSYGGFMSLSLALRSEAFFRGSLSVAPVTDWKLYDTFYTERYMQTPQHNGPGYEDTSLLDLADEIGPQRLSVGSPNKTHVYLVHGVADDNVHFQNAAEFVNRLIIKNVPLTTAYYPNQAHSINLNGALIHLYHSFRIFLQQHVVNFVQLD